MYRQYDLHRYGGTFPVTSSTIFFSPLYFTTFRLWVSSLELWYALSRRNFRHSINPVKKEQVAENFKKMYKNVRKDREDNAANAWKTRRTRLISDGVQLDSNTATKNGGVDFDDLDSF